MSDIPKLAETIQTVLGETADTLARETDFIKRERKFKGSSFAQTLIFGWTANPNSTLSELQQTAVASGVEVSAQALDKRFSEEASLFMYRLLQTALENLITANSPVAIPLFERFNGVYIDDASRQIARGLEIDELAPEKVIELVANAQEFYWNNYRSPVGAVYVNGNLLLENQQNNNKTLQCLQKYFASENIKFISSFLFCKNRF